MQVIGARATPATKKVGWGGLACKPLKMRKHALLPFINDVGHDLERKADVLPVDKAALNYCSQGRHADTIITVASLGL